MMPEVSEALSRPRYPGAHPFTDDPLSRRLFQGRDQESLAVINMVLAHRLMVIFARSGIGKTSLLNAGVAERLRMEGFIPLVVRVNDMSVGAVESVYQGIESACARQKIEYKVGDRSSLWHFFKSAEFWRGDCLLEPILILDQFEELFTLQSEACRQAFFDQLSCLVRGVPPKGLRSTEPLEAGEGSGPGLSADESPPRARVILSFREDYLPCLEEISCRLPGILDNRIRLLAFDREAAEKALANPSAIEDVGLSTQPFEIEKKAQTAVLDFLQKRREQREPPSGGRSLNDIEPFQLQLICQYMEDLASKKQRGHGSGSVKVHFEDLGGEARLRRILQDFCVRQIRSAPLLQRSGVKRLCSEYLISAQGRRLRMEESEIHSILGVTLRTLQTLVDRRLLRTEQAGDGTYYELSHDSLIQPVLRSQRWWFLGKMVGKVAIMLWFGVMFLSFSVSFIAGGMDSIKGWIDTIATLLMCSSMLLGVGWLAWRVFPRRFREARALWRRIRKG